MRIDDHQHEQRHQEDHGEHDRDAIEVLLDDAGARLGGIHGAGDHVGDARALAGMQQDEDDQADAGHDQQDEEDDNERIQLSSLF